MLRYLLVYVSYVVPVPLNNSMMLMLCKLKLDVCFLIKLRILHVCRKWKIHFLSLSYLITKNLHMTIAV